MSDAGSAATRTLSVFERHKRLTVAVLALVSIVGTDLVFTRVFHALRPRAPAAGSARLRIASPIFDHGFAPLLDVPEERWGPWASAYHTNSLGFRDVSARVVPLSSELRRIVFIGDSFTEGMGVAYEKTFVGLVGAALARQGVEVLNAGVASYCPIIYDRKARHLLDDVGLRFDELAVFIDIGDVQDEVMYKLDGRGNVVPRHARRRIEGRANRLYGDPAFGRLHRLEEFLDRHTLLLARVYDFLHQRLRKPGSRAALWTVDERAYEEFGREGLATAEIHMNDLAAALKRRGTALTVAVYPWPDQVRLGDRDSRQVLFWRRWAVAHGAGFLDYFPCFVGTRPANEVLATDFIPGDIHWTEAGHRVIAEGFLRHRSTGATCEGPR